MISISRPDDAPNVLTEDGSERTAAHCDEYVTNTDACRNGTHKIAFDSDIYGHESVKNSLLTAQYKKCCFCESKPRSVEYGCVEHYRPKGASKQRNGTPIHYPGYYWLAYAWENLLFCCTLCNTTKGTRFPLKDETKRARTHHDDVKNEDPLLIDPSRTNPRRYIAFTDEIAVPIRNNQKGRETIDVVGLNRLDLVEERKEHLNVVLTLYAALLEIESSDGLAEEIRRQLRQYSRPSAKFSSMIKAALPARFSRP